MTMSKKSPLVSFDSIVERVGPRSDGVIDAEDVAAEVESVLPHVQGGDRAAVQLCEEHAADADGTGPDDENAVAFARIGATHRVGADREELDHRRLIERDAVGRSHIALRHADVIGHSSINMNAQNGDALAAIGFAAPAGDAGAAGQIGDDKDLLTDRDGAAWPGLLHFAGQFVSDNSRILEKGMRAFVNVQIRAAHPGATNPHEHFAGTRRGSRPLDHRQFSRLHAKQGSQSPSSLFVFLFVMDKKRHGRGSSCFFKKRRLAQKDRVASGRFGDEAQHGLQTRLQSGAYAAA